MLFCRVTLKLLVINTSSSSPVNNKRRRLLLPATSVTNLPRSGADLTVAPLTTRDEAIDVGRESQFLPTPPAFDAPVRGDPRRNIAMTFSTENTRMVWIPDSETSSSAVAKRPCDASCLSVVSFNSTKCRVECFIVSYVGRIYA